MTSIIPGEVAHLRIYSNGRSLWALAPALHTNSRGRCLLWTGCDHKLVVRRAADQPWFGLILDLIFYIIDTLFIWFNCNFWQTSWSPFGRLISSPRLLSALQICSYYHQDDKLLISTSIVTSWLCKREYQPGDTRAEEKEDGDANDHIDGKGVKPSSSSSTSIAPPSSVVTPVVFLFDMLQQLWMEWTWNKLKISELFKLWGDFIAEFYWWHNLEFYLRIGWCLGSTDF